VATPAPDLVVISIDAPAVGLTSESYTLDWTIENQGTVPAVGPWQEDVFQSDDPVAGGDVLLGSFQVTGTLAAGASIDFTSAFTFPAQAGSYWIIVETDALGQVLEGDGEGNNVAVDDQPMVVQPSATPDLVVTSITPPSTGVVSGTSPTVSFTVQNQGSTATQVPFWNDVVFLTTTASLSSNLSVNTSLGAFQNQAVLNPGDSYSQTVPVTLPSDVFGTHYLAVYTDGAEAGSLGSIFNVVETDETSGSNVLFSTSFDITLEPQPDLEVQPGSMSIPTIVQSGTDVSPTWVIANIGTGVTDTGAWRDTAYLSPDFTLSPPGPLDIVLETVWSSSQAPLGPGGTTPRTATGFIEPDVEGPYFFKVFTDSTPQPNGMVSEFGFESNNITVFDFDGVGQIDPITIVLAPAMNLEPNGSPVVPATGIVDAHIQVDWAVHNTGSTIVPYASSWKDGLYLSLDTTLVKSGAGADVLLASYSQSTSANPLVGADYSKTRQVRIPSSTATGTYYVILDVDTNGTVYEVPPSGDDDNEAASSAISIVQPTADLEVEINFNANNTLPSAGDPGQAALPISWRVKNIGGATTAAIWADKAFLSNDMTISVDDVRLSKVTRNGVLAANESYKVAQEFQVPLVTPGLHYLLIAADENAKVLETGEANNLAVQSFTVTANLADLVVTTVGAPPVANSGSAISVSWTVQNVGAAPTVATAWTDSLYLSSDSVLDGGDTPLGARTRSGALADGDTYADAVSVSLPIELSGPYYLIVEADGARGVFELDENNNATATTSTTAIQLASASNLRVMNVQAPASLQSGQNLDLSWDVHNTGAGTTNASSWRDDVYLSLDESLDVQSDVYLGSAVHSATLAGSAVRPMSADLPVTLGLSGLYFVIVRTDAADEVWEGGSELDNDAHAVGLMSVVLAPPVDLVASNVSTPVAVMRGAQATFTWDVTNGSGASFVGSWTDNVFLSTDAVWDLGDVLFGAFETEVLAGDPLDPTDTIQIQGTGTVPPLTPGPYYAIVHCDVFNQVGELDETNNDDVSPGTFNATVTPLVLGTELVVDLPADKDLFFEFDALGGETLGVSLDHASETAWTNLLVRHGQVPTPGQFDFASPQAGLPDQELVIPTALAGKYYVLARGIVAPAPGSASATILAESLPFRVTSVLPPRVGDGDVTLRIGGSLFTPGATFQLRHAVTLDTVAAGATVVEDATSARATFSLLGEALGFYDLLADSGGQQFVVPAAIEVEPATSLVAIVDLLVPPAFREGLTSNARLRLQNQANVDIPFTLATITAREDPALSFYPENDPNESAPTKGLVQELGTYVGFLAAGEETETDFKISVDPGFVADRLGLSLQAQALTLEQFRDDHVYRYAEDLRQAVLADPSAEQEVYDLANQPGAWWSAVAGYYDQNFAGLLATQELAERGAAKAMCPFVDASLCVDLSGGGVWCAPSSYAVCNSFVWVDDCLQDPECGFCTASSTSAPGVVGPCVPVQESMDPNLIVGPAGYGGEAYVPLAPMQFQLGFENLSTASASAALVTIFNELDSDLDPTTFRLGNIQFGGTTINVASNSSFTQTQVDLSASMGVVLDVTAGIGVDPTSGDGRAFWVLQSLDPETGAPPTNPLLGFLPPENGTGIGQGVVEYSIEPRSSSVTGAIVTSRGDIVFDVNPPISTNVWTNTVDADLPTSAMTPFLPYTRTPNLQLNWSGQDVPGGSGLSRFELYVSTDGGPYVLFETTADTATTYAAPAHHAYRFYSLALDNSGNREPVPLVPDASTLLDYNKKVRFDGVDDVIVVPDDDSLDGFTAMTLELWLKASPQPSGGAALVSKALWNSGSATDDAWFLGLGQATGCVAPDGHLMFGINGTFCGLQSSGRVDDGQWRHVAVVWEPPSARLYLDGVLDAEQSWSTPMNAVAAPVTIGSLWDVTNQPIHFFQGELEEVRLWNRVLTAREIRDSFCGLLENTDRTVANWRFDEPDDHQTALDSTPFGNDGTLGTLTAPDPADPVRISSRRLQCGVTPDPTDPPPGKGGSKRP
jgi:hypothetical protein